MKEENLKQILEAVTKVHTFAAQVISNSKCTCGADWCPMPVSQRLMYDPEEKCMCDGLTFSCTECENTKEVKMPLRGGVYAKMAESYINSDGKKDVAEQEWKDSE